MANNHEDPGWRITMRTVLPSLLKAQRYSESPPSDPGPVVHPVACLFPVKSPEKTPTIPTEAEIPVERRTAEAVVG